jgi:hypothetical protein
LFGALSRVQGDFLDLRPWPLPRSSGRDHTPTPSLQRGSSATPAGWLRHHHPQQHGGSSRPSAAASSPVSPHHAVLVPPAGAAAGAAGQQVRRLEATPRCAQPSATLLLPCACVQLLLLSWMQWAPTHHMLILLLCCPTQAGPRCLRCQAATAFVAPSGAWWLRRASCQALLRPEPSPNAHRCCCLFFAGRPRHTAAVNSDGVHQPAAAAAAPGAAAAPPPPRPQHWILAAAAAAAAVRPR